MPERPGDMDERDVDARFASIVAGWEGPVPGPGTGEVDEPSDAGTPSPPAQPEERAWTTRTTPPADAPRPADAGEAADAEAADAGEAEEPPAPPSPWVNPSPLDVVVPASAWRAAEPPNLDDGSVGGADAATEAEDEHFEPPEVVLPPQEDLHFWGAVIGLVAGPLMLLYVVFARPFHSTRWFAAAVVVSLVGFALLVLRQPAHRDPTSGDDGARV